MPRYSAAGLCLIVTCMGRLAFVKRTLPRLLATNARVCLVDYSCPDSSGDWAEREFSREFRAGQLEVVRIPGQTIFHKPAALNAGARRGIELAADYLAFLDADTVLLPGFEAWLNGAVAPDRFLISLTGKSLFGFLATPTAAFARFGGYDESIQGYGAEDIEMRLRLYLRGGLCYGWAPPNVLRSIAHDDELRARHYRGQDIRANNAGNLADVRARVRQWIGRDLWECGPDVTRLYHVDPEHPPPRGPALVTPFVRDATPGDG